MAVERGDAPAYEVRAGRQIGRHRQNKRHALCPWSVGQRQLAAIRRDPAQHQRRDRFRKRQANFLRGLRKDAAGSGDGRSEEHTSELQSLMRISYAVFCLKKKKKTTKEEL